jgi:hypothetical protein
VGDGGYGSVVAFGDESLVEEHFLVTIDGIDVKFAAIGAEANGIEANCRRGEADTSSGDNAEFYHIVWVGSRDLFCGLEGYPTCFDHLVGLGHIAEVILVIGGCG